MHLKRNKVPKKWQIPRKGTAFLVRPNSNVENSVPILVVLRDMLNFAKTKKEAKAIIHARSVLVNSVVVTDEKMPVSLFDKIHFTNTKKSFEVSYQNKKFVLNEIPEKKAQTKIIKLVNKKVLGKDRIQLNFSDGRNGFFKQDIKISDSVVLNLKDNKIEKIMPIQKSAEIMVIGGKHLGKTGKIANIDKEKKTAEIAFEDSKVNISFDNLIVTD